MELKELRENFDRIDDTIVNLLVERFNLMGELIACKQRNGLSIVNKEREEALIRTHAEQFKESGYDDPVFVRNLFELIIKKATELQVEKQKALV